MGCARHHGHLRRGFALKQHAGKSLIHIGGNFPIMPEILVLPDELPQLIVVRHRQPFEQVLDGAARLGRVESALNPEGLAEF